MKKILMTLAAVLCCAMMTSIFTACNKSNDDMGVLIVGTWTEKNDLFTDILTLNEDGSFVFQSTAVPNMQSHANLYNGSGNYHFDVVLQIPDNNSLISNFDNRSIATGLLYLYYGGKETQKLEIRKLESSTLEMTDRYGHIFHFSK